MTSPLTYHVTQVRINDLLRDAADRQRAREAALQRHAPLSQMLRLPRIRRGERRQVLSDLDPRPATR